MGQFILLCAMLLTGILPQGRPARSILLFGNPTQTLLQQQLKLLQTDSNGLAERDLQIKIVRPGDILYNQFAVPKGQHFTFILVGRDGGEKFRSNQLTTTTQIFALIDAMPMRKAELRKIKNDHR